MVNEILSRSGVSPAAVEAVGCSGIGPCVLPVDDEVTPLGPGILYGIDTRASAQIERLDEELGAAAILERTGNALTSQSAGPKVAWLRDERPEAFAAAAMFHTCQSFLVARLTGEHVMDHTTAAYWGPFYDIHTNAWIEEWVAGTVEPERLPRLVWPTEVVGQVSAAAARATGLAAGTPVIAGAPDAPAEAVSAGVLGPGDLMVMYGSSIFMIAVVGETIVDPRMWAAPYVFEGTLDRGRRDIDRRYPHTLAHRAACRTSMTRPPWAITTATSPRGLPTHLRAPTVSTSCPTSAVSGHPSTTPMPGA